MDKVNISPFYAGQKVVCINASNLYLFKGDEPVIKGTIYEVETVVFVEDHNMWGVTLKGVKNSKTLQGKDRTFRADRFRAVEEQTMPLLKLEKIKELEKEEVLCPN